MNNSDRHAYLIMAHDNFNLLKKLVQVLDDKRNDIYIHIDKKSIDFNEDFIKEDIRFSRIIFIDRINVTWGGYSLIQCEINLMKAASLGNYQYYHFLSGVDLPIKNQDYIHEFFKKNDGKEFISFASEEFNKQGVERYSVYHYFQDKVGRKKSLLGYIEKVLVKVQKITHLINRTDSRINYVGGSQWCSLTNQCVKYILKNESLIERLFKYTSCCDEFFVQTLIRNSEFYNNVYKKDGEYCYMRYIDWKRGNPYIFDINDWDEINNSGCLFARKFGINTVAQLKLVNRVCKSLAVHKK